MPRSPHPKPDTAATTAPDSLTYEQALGELEHLVQAMESAQMPLDQMLASYKRGSELLQLCHGRLQAVEAQVKLLDDGRLEPWSAP
jgi:exodeoxyribonuclease VII small subunit